MRRHTPLATAVAILLLTATAYGLNFTSRTTQVQGISVGEVVLDNQVPLRIRYSAGGLSPTERATIIARRLSDMGELRPSDINVARVGPYWAVTARGELLATADPAHALANNTTTYGLALAWRNQLRSAVSQATGIPTPPVGAGPEDDAVGFVNTAQKVVPILSVGSGLRVGAALVAGSSIQVGKVNAVAQVEGQFGDRVRVRALVPIDTENIIGSLRRVPGTAVIAVADIRL